MPHIQDGVCPICLNYSNEFYHTERKTYKIKCPRCGQYEISEDALTLFLQNGLLDKILSISYWIRKHQASVSHFFYIDLKMMRANLIPFVAPKVNEQADNLILWLSNSKNPDHFIEIETKYLISEIGAYDDKGVQYISKHLFEDGLIEDLNLIRGINPNILHSRLTFKG